jgi:hypothetical protein
MSKNGQVSANGKGDRGVKPLKILAANNAALGERSQLVMAR